MEPLPVLHSPAPPHDRADWVARHRAPIRELLAGRGAVLVRGLAVASAGELADVAAALGVAPMTEREGFAPRMAHPRGVYSASQWPADEAMCMHHELSYAAEVPGLLMFACLRAAREGGDIAVADSQELLGRLPAAPLERFTREGWLLTRVYHEAGVAWQQAFGTGSRSAVAEYCAAAGIEHEWLPDDRLVTRQRRAAVVHHPATGRPAWCNQIAFLNEHTLDPAVREYLLDLYGALPFNTAYGDGGELERSVVDAINDAYRAGTAGEPWRDGDLLLIDNIRMAHARDPYRGEREILTMLAEPVRLTGHVLAASAAQGG
ncbi:TauD/TfdA family dioxygenase [Dactylosporangium vinaceum]|uniref:TauD/TfdA family dioxygenase n=1 Tax=Dactylosporangium vinaceum TaxID=53362 RepID=A0ABV5M2U3_9ACTN|nr:TauD/TfdA family dioxygenase [Dactylosporangium vinaceum]UAB99885.1 TauD/TfdA family dioxygenase [Dactylosporangium vinaceum]